MDTSLFFLYNGLINRIPGGVGCAHAFNAIFICSTILKEVRLWRHQEKVVVVEHQELGK